MALPQLVFLILFLLHSVSAQQNVTLNSSLIANDNSLPWLSPSGDFAFGFKKLSNTDQFLLAIWLVKIPDETIVWYANGDNPAPRGSRVEITANGLALTDPNGRLVWQEQLTQAATVSYGSMLDSGNFVLVDSNSVNLWESFNNPKDTILPSQALKSSAVLFSRFAETNFSRGRFKLFFSNEGDLTLSPLAWPTELQYGSYFSSGNSGDNSESVNQLVFNESSSDIYLMNTNGERITLPWKPQNIAPSIAASYYRATLDYTGVFTVYSYPRGATSGDESWSIVQYLPQDICSALSNDLGSGSCGYNSYCIIVDGRPACKCPPGYSFIDDNNQFGGCVPDFPLVCGGDESANLEDIYEFQPLPNVNWPMGDYEHLPNYSEQECRTSCLRDCFCAAAIYSFTSTCWKKRMPLGNGRVDSGTAKALIRVRKGPIRTKKGHNESILVGSLSASLVINALLFITVSSILFLFCNRNSSKLSPVSTFLETNLHMFSYKELEAATNNFREEIGRGSSAIVYKAILKFDSNNVAAVKKFDKLGQLAEKEFKTEMKVIGKTSHKNLVRLLGFCEEGPHSILVYEFMNNGTLAKFLFGNQKPAWNIRAKIALEIARGLVYLHEECEVPIIHCDIKPENVLLDESYTAKISDFGLAKLLNLNQSQTLTGIRGTRGYVAPEWFRNSTVTVKVDVYSFGVMLLEIIYCRKNAPKAVDAKGGIILTDWVYDCFLEGKIDVLAEIDEEGATEKERIERWAIIGIWCTQEDPSERPSMKTVLQMLEGTVDVPLPSKPHFSSSFYSRVDAITTSL